MKKSLIILSLASLLAACGNNGQNSNPETNNKELPDSVQASAPAIKADTTALDEKPGQDELSLSGTIAVDPARYASVTVLMGGSVGSINVRPGQYVSQGSVIATLNNPEFVELQQSYIEAVAQTEFLEAEYQRQKTLVEGDAGATKKLQQSKAEYQSMKSRKDAGATQLRLLGVNPNSIVANGIIPSLAVKSPISGYVGDITANIGKYISTGESLCTIVDQSAAILRLTAFSRDASDIKIGTRLTFSTKAMPGEKFDAVVSHIDPIMDASTHSLTVYAKITGKHRNFNVGMYVRAKAVED